MRRSVLVGASSIIDVMRGRSASLCVDRGVCHVHRLATVTTMIRDHVDTAPSGGIRCVSLCTGECRDLTDALAGHPRARDLTGVIIELDPVLAARAKTRITEANLDL
jgi:hypothetical protein